MSPNAESESDLVLTRGEWVQIEQAYQRLMDLIVELNNTFGPAGGFWADYRGIVSATTKIGVEAASIRAIIERARKDNANLFRDEAFLPKDRRREASRCDDPYDQEPPF